jgi:hypothetical protein
MTILHIEHAVADFAAWKQTFDGFAPKRAEGGVTSYRVMRPVGNEHYAFIELEFADAAAAQTFLSMLQQLWQRVDGTLITSPRGQILEVVEARAV